MSREILIQNWKLIEKRVIEPLWNKTFKDAYVSSKLDKDDFLSLAGEELTKAFDTYDADASNVCTYATNVLKRKAKTELRNMRRQKRLGDLYAESIHQQTDDSNNRIEDMIEDIDCNEGSEELELELVLKEIYTLLKPKERKVIELSIKGLSNNDIANILHVEPKVVNEIRRIISDRSDIKRVLRRHGYLGGMNDEI